ncbi:hypothetical protein [uncultured Polaribacter sp.]|uniref:hypothetical protein n=1 Tax=uncultured Polaribacter sp. TaxID=174711 RepID=UPI00261C5015|nr:hypothetical protein [uncultured Polaribacter sp.]
MTYKNWHDLLVNSNYILVVLNTLLYFIGYRNNSVAYKIICFYLLLCTIVQGYSSYLASFSKPNLFLSHYYFVGQFLLLSLFYKQILKGAIKKKVINLCLLIVPILVAIIYIVKPEEYLRFNLIEVIITSLPLVFFAFLFFLENLNFSKKFIYFNSGVFVYLIASTFLFSVGNYIVEAEIAKSITSYVWILNNIMYSIYLLLIFVEWYKNFLKPNANK